MSDGDFTGVRGPSELCLLGGWLAAFPAPAAAALRASEWSWKVSIAASMTISKPFRSSISNLLGVNRMKDIK